MPIIPPTVGQIHASSLPASATSGAKSAQLSPLAGQHKVASGSDGIARFFSDLFTSFVALFTPSSASPAPKPFATLAEAKSAFTQLAHAASKEKSEATQRNAAGLSEQPGHVAGERTFLDPTDKGAIYKYSEDGWMSYSDMNGLVMSALKDSEYLDRQWETLLSMSLRMMMNHAGTSLDQFLARVPAQDQDAFRDFAKSYYGSMVAHQVVMAREALEKLPPKPCISDRGLREFEGAVDGFKKMLTTEGQPRFLQEPGFSSSTTLVQSPQDLKDGDRNKATFPNQITLLTIGRTGKDISTLSASPHESEVLFSAESRFEVFGHKEVTAGDKTKNVFFQLQLSAADFALFQSVRTLDLQMERDPTYKLNDADRATVAAARQFNGEVKLQLEEFPQLGWKDDMSPGVPATCRFFQKVIDEAAQR